MASLKDNLMQQLSSFLHQRLLAVAQEMLGQVERALALALDGERPQGTTASGASEADRTFTDPNQPGTRPDATQSHYSLKEALVLRICADQSNETLDCTLGETKEEEVMYAIEPERFIAPLSDDDDEDDDGDDAEPSRDRKNNESEQPATIEEKKATRPGEKPFCCDVCGKRFKSTCSLTTHKHIHTGDKLHQCDVCEKAFTIKGNLENHMRVHTGEKPFSCDICGKGFCVKWNLSTHMRTHTGERPFHCDACGKAFTNSSGLTNHKRSHTGERPYSCVACGKAFSRSGHLTRHVHKKQCRIPAKRQQEPPGRAAT